MYHVKRPREEDEVDLDIDQAATKRVRMLPFRSSPTSQHTTLFSSSRQIPKPPALTTDSSDEESDGIEFQSPQYQPRPPIPTFFSTDMDVDYEPDNSQPMASPLFSPKTPVPGLLSSSTGLPSPVYTQLLTVASPHNVTGRVPTPIYGHFSSVQRTTLANAHSPTAANPPPAGVVRGTNEQNDAFLRRRRLPSPICETHSESPTTVTNHMLQGLAMSTTPASATFPTPAPADDMACTGTGAAEEPMSPTTAFYRRKSSGDESGGSGSGSGSSFSSVPSATGGRRRSDAVSVGESRKFVFSMGFRADCEKCRERVPGHYSHVLRV